MKLELKDINFSFSHKIVLDKLNISFNEGKLHGLLGENGAGKSTTANIICGELIPSSGKILLNNQEVHFSTPKDAINNHICYVHQRPMLCENITVYENLIIGLSKQQIKKVSEFSKALLPGINLKTPIFHITSDYRFFISLTNALLKEPEILILDEPSALLNKEQISFLYSKLCHLTKKGMNIIVITHSQEEAEKYCDDVFYLNSISPNLNKLAAESTKSNENNHHKENTNFPLKSKNSIEVNWNNINCKTRNHIPLKNINLKVQSGKITLVKGYAEQGLSQLEDILCGMNKFKCQGKLSIKKNNQLTTYSLSKGFSTYKLRNKCGLRIGIIPTNKKFRGANPALYIKDMLTFKQNFITPEKIIEKSKINISKEEKASALSGGMLQRLLINRELAGNPELLILCNPLQGLDKASCINIKNKLEKLAAENTAILILSNSEFPEEICSLVHQLKKGEFV